MDTYKTSWGSLGTGHGRTSCCWDSHEYRAGAQVLDLEPLFRMWQKYSSPFGWEMFLWNTGSGSGIVLSCLLTTLAEVLCFVLLLPFEILRHHLPICTKAEGHPSSALGPTTPAICCLGAAFGLMLPLPLWNGTSGLCCFVWFYHAKQWGFIPVLAAST